MADTTFTDAAPGTPIVAAWLNDVNDFVYGNFTPDTVRTIYVATTGSDSNTGLTVGSPFATLQKAFDYITDNYIDNGSWKISIAAGTYSTASNRAARIGPANIGAATAYSSAYNSDGVVCKNYIYIEGPNVGWDPATTPTPTPTAIFDGGGAAAVAIQIEGPIKVLVRDIKFQNYNGSSNSGGIIGDGADIRCENVHGDANYYSISNSSGRLEVKGGTLSNATGAEIRSIFLNKHEIGNQSAGAPGQGPFFSGSTIGVYAQEGATGHADYCTFTSCTDGIYATVNSRVNYTGSSFTSCTRGVRALQSYVFASSATFTSCTENKVIQMHAVDAPRDNYGNSGLASDYLGATATTHTGTVNSTVILSKTLNGGEWAPNVTSIRKPQHIKFLAYGTMSGTAGTKQFKLRLGSTLLATITNAAADTGSWKVEGIIVFTDSNAQSANITYTCHLANLRVNTDTGTEDLSTSNATLQFEVQLANAADTIVIQHAHFETWG